MKTLIKDGYIYDPANRREGVHDIFIVGNKIIKVAKKIKEKADRTIEASRMVVLPGLIDMHAHLREPGREDAETIETGLDSASRGGFTSVCAMPNTTPCCDNQGVVELMLEKARNARLAHLFPIGAITKNREGKELSEVGELRHAGCVAVSDDGHSVKDSSLLRRAMEYSLMFDIPIISHCEDVGLSQEGVMHEGYVSTVLGMKGIPSASESIIVARDLQLAEFTGARIHIAHVSSRESLDLIKHAKAKGVRVTCETCPHYLIFTDEDVRTFDTNFKMNPPLRTSEDREALRQAVHDGTIDVIATDHAPHIESEKDVEFDYAPFGIIGFETAVASLNTLLIRDKITDWNGIVELMSLHPAKILGLDKGTLGEGKEADITIIDPNERWVCTKDEIRSKSKNSPFIGFEFKGNVKYAMVSGHVTFGDVSLHRRSS
ncbi:MAG: dihydroorotase [Candidatus Omnitrophica bacterium]|nr:dihydroorotase [Candidatus Omnitrophota bacterium]